MKYLNYENIMGEPMIRDFFESDPFWFSEEKCEFVQASIQGEEKPVTYCCVDPLNDQYIALYDRRYLSNQTMTSDQPYIMDSSAIWLHFKLFPENYLAGRYPTDTITFAGLNSNGEILYDVRKFPGYKPWRLNQLFK